MNSCIQNEMKKVQQKEQELRNRVMGIEKKENEIKIEKTQSASDNIEIIM